MVPRCPGPVHATTASQGETERTFSELTKDQFTEAHDNADKLISGKYRSYLPGRLLSLLLRRYRDDPAEALGMPLPCLDHGRPLGSRGYARSASTTGFGQLCWSNPCWNRNPIARRLSPTPQHPLHSGPSSSRAMPNEAR